MCYVIVGFTSHLTSMTSAGSPLEHVHLVASYMQRHGHLQAVFIASLTRLFFYLVYVPWEFNTRKVAIWSLYLPSWQLSLASCYSLTRIFTGFWGVLFQILVHRKTGHDLFSRKIFWPHIQRSDPLYMLQNCTLNCFYRRAHLHLFEDKLDNLI